MKLSKSIKNKLLRIQKNEITEYIIYRKLARRAKGKNDKETLEKIADEELTHYRFLKEFTGEDVRASRFRIFLFYTIARGLGLNFGLRLMEKGEESVQGVYGELKTVDPKIENIIREEEEHEERILDLLDKEELAHTGSIVLGLNDALVELTGALSGLTLALQKTTLIAVVGFITGIAASLSMAASEYLSSKEEGKEKPFKASVYTGSAYVFTVLFLILPYTIFRNPFFCLGVVITFALVIIFIFTFYVSVAKDLSFKRKFIEMALISLGVAGLNFFIGLFIRTYFKIDV